MKAQAEKLIINRLTGNLATALSDFEVVLHIDPHNIQNLSNLATVHFQMHHFREANEFIKTGKEETEKQNNHFCDNNFINIERELMRINLMRQQRNATPISTKENDKKEKNSQIS